MAPRKRWPNEPMWLEAVKWHQGGLTYKGIAGQLAKAENMTRFGLTVSPSEPTVRREIKARLASVGRGGTATPSGLPSYDPANYVFFVPYAQKGNQFIGCEEALQDLRRQLVSGRRASIGQAAGGQALGGIGKTQLAVEYAYRFKDEYPNGVIWINADQDIEAQVSELTVKASWIAPDSEPTYRLVSGSAS